MGLEERAAVDEVLRCSGRPEWPLVHGKKNQELEERFADRLGVKHAVAVSSCTAGLGIGYRACEPKRRGRFLIRTVPAMSHVATAHAANYENSTLVFRDECVWDGRWNDKALNIDTPPKGWFAVYSLYPSKNLTCGGDGGIIATDDHEIVEACRSLRAFGYSDRMGLHYDVDRLAGNSRLSEVHAAIAVEQLKKLDGFQERRRENVAALDWDFPYMANGEVIGDYYCVNIYVENRGLVVRRLQERGVGVSIHYPIPVPMTKYYREKYGHKSGDFPKAEEIARTAISLPIGPHLDTKDMKVIAEAVCQSV